MPQVWELPCDRLHGLLPLDQRTRAECETRPTSEDVGLAATLLTLETHFHGVHVETAIIIVDNGSIDRGSSIAHTESCRMPPGLTGCAELVMNGGRRATPERTSTFDPLLHWFYSVTASGT